MKNIFKLILALILIYIILITNIADINHGEGVTSTGDQRYARVLSF